jgi:hypothetical protein
MANQAAPNVTSISGPVPASVLENLQNAIATRSKLEEGLKKLITDNANWKEQWTFDFCKEGVKGINPPSVVNLTKDFDKKQQTFDEQKNSLEASIEQLNDTIRTYEKDPTKRQQLIHALHDRMEQVDVACKEHEHLRVWRNRLLSTRNKQSGRGAAKA